MALKKLVARILPDDFIYTIWHFLRHRPVLMMRAFGVAYGLNFATATVTEGDKNQPKILVIHGLDPGSRQTTVDYVTAFLENPVGAEVTVANVFGFMPSWLGEIPFDLAVVTTEALSYRSIPMWAKLEKRIIRSMASAKRRVLIPQDDYTDSQRLDALAVKARIHTIYSPLIKGLDVIYPKSIKAGVNFTEALTGYFDVGKVKARSEMAKPFLERNIDIGQRVNKLAPQFGEIGIRKFELARVVCEAAENRGLRTDFSSDPEDVFLGEDWFRFLGNTRFTVSCRGGSSIVDAKGKIAKRLKNLKKYRPNLSEEEAFRLASFRSAIYGEFDAVSPRLFDAALMGVCQILLEDDYMGMEPWVHYIPLKHDYSNLNQVFEAMENTDQVEQIIQNARNYLIDPARFSYSNFVQQLFNEQIHLLDERKKGRSTLVDVDANCTGIPGIQLRESFTNARTLARSRVKQGLLGFGGANSLHSGFAISEPLIGQVTANWVTTYLSKPAFPEFLIFRWCPLSWFLDVDQK